MASDEVALEKIEDILTSPDFKVKPQQKIEALKELSNEGFRFSSHADAERIVSALASVAEIARDPGVRAAALEAMGKAMEEEKEEDDNDKQPIDWAAVRVVIYDPRTKNDYKSASDELSRRQEKDPERGSPTEFLKRTAEKDRNEYVRIIAESLLASPRFARPEGGVPERSLVAAREG